jgi:hypothetical protein
MAKTDEEKVIRDIAIHLNWNLHSGAGENIISSLLAASFNDSQFFQNWFLKRCFGDAVKTFRHSAPYAWTNFNIESTIVRTLIKYKPSIKDYCYPVRPDIFIQDYKQQDKWDQLLYSKDKTELLNALRNTRFIHIEVKRSSLSTEDHEKYKNLIDGLSNLRKSGLGIRKRFVLISSHNNRDIDKLKERRSKSSKKIDWLWYIEREKEGIIHVTLPEIEDNIKESWCVKCPILKLFKNYLILYLGDVHIDNGFYRAYWEHVANDGNSDIFDIKSEIADTVNWLADKAWIHKKRNEKPWDQELSYCLRTIEISQQNEGKREIAWKYNRNASKNLTIILGDKNLDFNESNMRKPERIIQNLIQVINFFKD